MFDLINLKVLFAFAATQLLGKSVNNSGAVGAYKMFQIKPAVILDYRRVMLLCKYTPRSMLPSLHS